MRSHSLSLAHTHTHTHMRRNKALITHIVFLFLHVQNNELYINMWHLLTHARMCVKAEPLVQLEGPTRTDAVGLVCLFFFLNKIKEINELFCVINIFVRGNFLFTKTPKAVNNEVNIHIYVVMYVSFFVYNEAGGINLINEINKFGAGSKKA